MDCPETGWESLESRRARNGRPYSTTKYSAAQRDRQYTAFYRRYGSGQQGGGAVDTREKADGRSPRRTQAERSAAMRLRLLEATVNCLVTYGYASTTTHRVAELAIRSVKPNSLAAEMNRIRSGSSGLTVSSCHRPESLRARR